MWLSYLQTAMRALARQKLYVAINVLGLAVGVAAALLVITYVRFETSYDEFQPNVASTYRMGVVALDLRADPVAAYAPLLTHEVARSMPEIVELLTLAPYAPGKNAERGEDVRVGDRMVRLVGHYAASANLTDFVSVAVVVGDLRRALMAPNEIALSRSEALRIFGTTDVIGRQLLRESGTWTVAAVFEDLPPNTHYDFKSLSTAEGLPERFSGYAYARVKSGTDLETLARRIADLVNARTPYEQSISFHPVADLHLATNGGRTAVNIAMTLSAILIAIAALNFVNMATAQAGRRTLEIGVRKALGASRVRLVTQYLVESVLVAMMAGLLAGIIASVALPWFNALVDRDLSLTFLGESGVMLLAIAACVGVAAGLYPAFFLSSFTARHALSRELMVGTTGVKIRKALFVVQAALSAGLIVVTLVLFQQMRYLQELPTGYAKKQRLEVGRIDARMAYAKADAALFAELERIPGVSSATFFDRSLTEGSASVIDVIAPGSSPRAITSGFTGTGFRVVETLGLELLAGRDFAPEYGNDWYREDAQGVGYASVVIPESMSRAVGYVSPREAIGQRLTLDVYETDRDKNVTIVGVVRDLKVGSVSQEHRPIFFICGFSWARTTNIVLHLTDANLAQVQPQVARVLQQRFGVHPAQLDQRLTEEQYAAIYRHEEGQADLIRIFASLAVFLSCVGSFGLAAFSAQRRRREFAIRRIQGATRFTLTNLLLNEYLGLIGWSTLLAFPIAYAWLAGWLSNFSERVEQSPVAYVLAVLLLCAATCVAISGLALRAAKVRPAEALRHE